MGGIKLISKSSAYPLHKDQGAICILVLINHKLIKMKKYLLFGLAIVFSFGVNAQWKGTTSNDDQRTMMVQRHMDLYPKNDQSQLKNIFNEASSINVNGTNISPEELANFEKMHHKIFKGIKFQVGANITSKYENGQIWTHVWAWWSGEGKKSKETATIPVHLAFNWDGLKCNNAFFMFDPTFINKEIALNDK